MKCPRCGASNYPGQRNCRSCLASLGEYDDASLRTILRVRSLNDLHQLMSTPDMIRYAIALDFEVIRRILRRGSRCPVEALHALDGKIWRLEKKATATLKTWANSDSRRTRILYGILSFTACLIAYLVVLAIVIVCGGGPGPGVSSNDPGNGDPTTRQDAEGVE